MIQIDDLYIDSQMKLLDSFDFDSVFDDDSEDIMSKFCLENMDLFKKFCLALGSADQDPFRLFCKLHLREFIYYVCCNYCSLDYFFNFEKKSLFRLQAEIVYLLEKNNIKYMNELKRILKSDDDLLEVFSDYDFNLKLKKFLMARRFLGK